MLRQIASPDAHHAGNGEDGRGHEQPDGRRPPLRRAGVAPRLAPEPAERHDPDAEQVERVEQDQPPAMVAAEDDVDEVEVAAVETHLAEASFVEATLDV